MKRYARTFFDYVWNSFSLFAGFVQVAAVTAYSYLLGYVEALTVKPKVVAAPRPSLFKSANPVAEEFIPAKHVQEDFYVLCDEASDMIDSCEHEGLAQAYRALDVALELRDQVKIIEWLETFVGVHGEDFLEAEAPTARAAKLIADYNGHGDAALTAEWFCHGDFDSPDVPALR